MSAIERRKADIEEKRRKVAELRRAREERSRAAAASGQPSSAGTTPRDGASLSRPSSSLADTRPGSGLATGVRTPPQSASGAPPPPPRIDDFVASILGPSSASAASASPTGSHSAKRLSSAAPENIQSPTSASESASASVAGDHAAPGDVVTSPVAPASPVPVRPAKAEAAVETSADELASRLPPAPPKVTYDKSVQASEALRHKEQQEQAAAAARGASSGDPMGSDHSSRCCRPCRQRLCCRNLNKPDLSHAFVVCPFLVRRQNVVHRDRRTRLLARRSQRVRPDYGVAWVRCQPCWRPVTGQDPPALTSNGIASHSVGSQSASLEAVTEVLTISTDVCSPSWPRCAPARRNSTNACTVLSLSASSVNGPELLRAPGPPLEMSSKLTSCILLSAARPVH